MSSVAALDHAVRPVRDSFVSFALAPDDLPSADIAGALSEEQIENARIYECPVVENYCRQILDKLRPAMEAKGLEGFADRIRFYTSDENGLASTNSRGEEISIIVDRHLIEIAESEDEIAWCISHEIYHRWLRERGGKDRSSRAAVVDEAECDRLALDLVECAGYARSAAGNLLKRLIDQGRGVEGSFFERMKKRTASLGDNHFSLETRYTCVMTDFTGAPRLITGDTTIGSKATTTPVPEFVVEAARSSRHYSFFDRVRARTNFDALPSIDQLHLAAEWASLLSNGARKADFQKLVNSINPSDKSLGAPETRELLDELVDSCMEDRGGDERHVRIRANQSNRHLLEPIYNNLNLILSMWEDPENGPVHSDSYKPLGRFRVIAESIKSLERAQSFGQALAAAETYRANRHFLEVIRERNSFGDLIGYIPVYIEKIHLPTEQFLPGHRLLQFAAQDQSGAIALMLMESIACNFKSQFDLLDLLPFNIAEKAISLEDESSESERLKSYLRERRARESAEIPVSEFRRDPAAYIKRNFTLLAPAPSEYRKIVPGSPYYKINGSTRELHFGKAQELCDEFCRMLDAGDADAHDLIRDFFLENTQSPIKQIKNLTDRSPYPAESPYVQFLVQHQEIFSPRERLEIAVHLNLGTLPLEWWSDYIGAPLPQNYVELIPFLGEFYGPGIGTPRPRFGSHFGRSTAVGELPTRLFLKISSAAPPAASTDDAIEVISAAAALPEVGWIGDEASAIRQVFRQAVQLLDPAETLSTTNLSFLTFIYSFCQSQGVFADDEMRSRWGDVIAAGIESRDSPEERKTLYDSFFQMNRTIQDVEMSRKMAQGWAEAVCGVHGKDMGGSGGAYNEAMLSCLRKLGEEIGSGSALFFEVAVILADEIEAQPALAYAIRDIRRQNVDKSLSNNLPIRGIEEVWNEASRSPERVRDIIDFLTAPLTQESTETLMQSISGWGLGDIEDSRLLRGLVSDTVTKQERKAAIALALHDVHENFWSRPVEIRVVIAKHLLMPAEQYSKDPRKTVDSAVELTLDKLFPEVAPAAAEEAEVEWARKFVRAFLTASHESEWGFILSAMLSASRASSGGGHVSTGKKLKCLLENLGPAYQKAGQAAHSCGRVPEEIRKELASLKTYAGCPPRWDVLALMEEEVPPEIRKTIDRYGPTVGAASFNLVTLAEQRNGRRVAVAVLRPYALSRAHAGFDTLSAVTDIMSREHEAFAVYRDDAHSIVAGARSMTAIETDMKLGAQQHAIARKQYGGLIVAADGLKFRFSVVPWIAHGGRYRLMEEAEGRDFDDLPSGTRAERRYRSGIAKAILGAELLAILKGRFFDCDRHEGQYKISGDVISVYDHGGMILSPPSEDEKKALGRILGEVAKAAIEGKGVEEGLASALRQEKVPGGYVSNVQRGLLALSFAFREIPQHELPWVLLGVLSHSEANPVVVGEMCRSCPELLYLRSTVKRAYARMLAWKKGGMMLLRMPCLPAIRKPKFVEGEAEAPEEQSAPR